MTSSSNIILSSLIADSLALGPHWIYSSEEIRSRFGVIDALHPPASSYHPGKSAGDFTHYGDQTLLLLRSLADCGRFDLSHFAATWQAFWENPATTSYRDGATRTTLENLRNGRAIDASASSSGDLGGAARSAPLFALTWQDDADLIAASRQLAVFTHGDPAVADAAECFVRTTLSLKNGATMADALTEASSPHASLTAWLAEARKTASSSLDDAAALDQHGLSCHVEDAFKSVCHLLLRHPQAPALALSANATAGGDSAARGLILGMIFGAAFPVTELPSPWLDDLNAAAEIQSLLNRLS